MAPGSALFGLVGWTVVPDLVTRQLLSFLHRTLATKLPAFSPPVPGTPAYRKHYAYTFAFVVLGYLLYNMVQSARALPPNFYEILGVAPNVDENGLKVAFRQFAKRNHPDRPGVGEEGARLFMMVREVFEALKNPVVRFAYDRFGPTVLSWRTCTTQRDFLHQGILQASGYHIVTGAALLFWSTIGKPSPVSFWRYLFFSFFLISELTLILAPSGQPTHILAYFFPNRVTFQHILFLHQLFIFFSVALSRVAPLFTPPDNDPRVERAILEKTQLLASVADREASIILHTDLHSVSPSTVSPATNGRATLPLMTPLPPNETASFLQSITSKMCDLIIEHNLKKDSGPLRSAWEQAITRGKASAAATDTGASVFSTDDAHLRTPKAKNFWEMDAENINTTDPAGSSIIDGSAYYVVDETKDTITAENKPEAPNANEPLPSPRPSPPRSPSPRRPASPTKKTSQELWVD
ncbi:DnaJ-domain-containing protein [Macrolepiota fuliginosa MF-IS2]|uniref:DnaJ-domain-containing protein n=1 Tax=Macrolepiota fuliginosa MF-IS2 TaxID=1400762 RepID=A0A9P5X032_9AGAR|nr:DnaJ-domain-containing protein [Macrolepiota fuliginosa MF-IS2]